MSDLIHRLLVLRDTLGGGDQDTVQDAIEHITRLTATLRTIRAQVNFITEQALEETQP